MPAAPSILLVPVHLDALFVGADGTEVAAQSADFSRLPYTYQGRDVNAEVPWLGASIAARPFEDRPGKLEGGVHLHWTLPAALCRASPVESSSGGQALAFPAVPDRWLVIRSWRTSAGRQVLHRVVESNYLHPEDMTPDRPAVSYPVPGNLRPEPGRRPFRYLGRVQPLQQWIGAPAADAEYLPEPLTVLGYGIPTFATLYSNCQGVFGLHDVDAPTDPGAELQYQLLGWYSDPAQDYLRRSFEGAVDGPAAAQSAPRTPRAILESLGWATDGDPPALDDVRLVCQAQLTFSAAPSTAEGADQSVEVTIANTITEAISTHLAAVASTEDSRQPRAQVEDQLEAVLLASRLEPLHADVAAKFQEARHAKGFTTAPPAFTWTLRPARVDAPSLGGDRTPEPELKSSWPDGVAELLDALNALQRKYNDAWDDIRARRKHIASDWHKYMLCAHPAEGRDGQLPNPDAVLWFIERHDLPEVERLLAETGHLVLIEVEGAPTGSRPDVGVTPDSLASSLAARIVEQVVALHTNLVPPPLVPSGAATIPWAPIIPRFFLQRQVTPRYHEPTEPVVLLTGPGIELGGRHRDAGVGREDGAAGCLWLRLDRDIPHEFDTICEALGRHRAWADKEWTEPPWHPLLLEWEVELRPLKHVVRDYTSKRSYDPECVVRNFTLKRGDVDLSPRSDAPALARRARVYRGASILTPHGVDAYLTALDSELARDADRALDRALPPETRARLFDALHTLRQCSTLAQSLSGFNDALLMNRQELQLPIDDPLGFPAERAVAARVRSAVGDWVHQSPQATHGFVPIRSGELRLSRLRLVDNFGRRLEIDCERVVVRSARTLPKRPGTAVMLPPRLMQPARLHFRWLAARLPARETTAHHAATPICGWVVANHVDQNLFVHATSGEALGYLEAEEQRVHWRSAPGRAAPLEDLDTGIEDVSLRRFLRFLLAASGPFFDTFLRDVEASQALIEPAESGDTRLMGRPLAVVRASIALQLQGPAAIHHGWHQLARELRGGTRTTESFTRVRFPIRLGEQDQLGDGLAVYFVEDERGAYDGYVIPAYDTVDPNLRPQDRRCDFLYQSLDSPPVNVTMLVDPRGAVHATTGLLPVKSIDIPAHHYRQALQNLEFSFLAAPILVDRLEETAEVAIPVASAPDYAWTFLEKDGRGFAPPRPVRTGPLHTPFTAPVAIREGWLHLARPPATTKDPKDE